MSQMFRCAKYAMCSLEFPSPCRYDGAMKQILINGSKVEVTDVTSQQSQLRADVPPSALSPLLSNLGSYMLRW